MLAAEPFQCTHDLDDLAALLPPVYPRFARQAEAMRQLLISQTKFRSGPFNNSGEYRRFREKYSISTRIFSCALFLIYATQSAEVRPSRIEFIVLRQLSKAAVKASHAPAPELSTGAAVSPARSRSTTGCTLPHRRAKISCLWH